MNSIRDYKYKYDLHVHTSPVSKCGDFSPVEVVNKYIKLGFAGIVITNHFHKDAASSYTKEDFIRYYLNDYQQAREYGEKNNFKVLLALEIRFPESDNEYLIYGIDEKDVSKAFDYLSSDYKIFYKEFKRDDILIIQAHPYRNRCFLQDLSYLDGIEAYNLHPGHNSAMGVAAKIAHDNPDLLITGGTDFHHETHQGMCAMCTKEKITDSLSLVSAIKSRNIIFDIWGSKLIPPYNKTEL